MYRSEVLQLHSLTSALDSRFRSPNRSGRFIHISYCTGAWVDHKRLRKFDDSAKIQTQDENQLLFTDQTYLFTTLPFHYGLQGTLHENRLFHFSAFIYQGNNILDSYVKQSASLTSQ